MKRSHVLASIAIGALAAACGIPRSPGGYSDSLESRCAQGFDMLETSLCRGGDPRTVNPAFTKYQLEQFSAQCKDAASVARVEKIKTTCVVAQQAKVDARKEDRRKVRARYLTQVSELLLDPAYAPLVDRYKDLEEQAFHGDREAKLVAQATLAQLAELVQRHGIDPTYGKELQLW